MLVIDMVSPGRRVVLRVVSPYVGPVGSVSARCNTYAGFLMHAVPAVRTTGCGAGVVRPLIPWLLGACSWFTGAVFKHLKQFKRYPPSRYCFLDLQVPHQATHFVGCGCRWVPTAVLYDHAFSFPCGLVVSFSSQQALFEVVPGLQLPQVTWPHGAFGGYGEVSPVIPVGNSVE